MPVLLRTLPLSLGLVALLAACETSDSSGSKDTGPIGNDSDTDTGETGDTDTGDSGTDSDTDTGDSGTDSDTDTGDTDTGDTDTGDTDTGETGDSDTAVEVDDDGDGYSVDEGDCDDNDSAVNPGARERCDDIDNDCDGRTDDEDALADGEGSEWYPDIDTDGYGAGTPVTACERPEDYVSADGDCDDYNAAVNPAADEVCDGEDNDCDGMVDDDDILADGEGEVWYPDDDGDGYGDLGPSVLACEGVEGYVDNAEDCDDGDRAVNPSATEDDCADPTDYNCDGSVAYEDADGDGWAACEDCDDNNAERTPDGIEVCEDRNVDEDCDGLINEDDPSLSSLGSWYVDADGDGYGTGDPVAACEQPDGYAEADGDCDDSASGVNPAATEVCDDADADEDCDGYTDDADGSTSTSSKYAWYDDDDDDGAGDPSDVVNACEAPTGRVDNAGDCDDTEPTVYIGATEVCDTFDNDCNGLTDDDPIDGGIYATDNDADGFGEAGTTDLRCSGAENEWDCDDRDYYEPRVASVSTGSASGNGLIDDPFDTIQAAIDAADTCVIVYAGTYAEAIDFGGKDLVVSSLSGTAETIIDATGTGSPAVSFSGGETSAATLSGFTLQAGEGYLDSTSTSTACGSDTTCYEYYDNYCGGGIYVSGADPTLSDLVIQQNLLPSNEISSDGTDTWYTYSFGGGACFQDSSAVLSDVYLYGNFAGTGGGIYVASGSVITLSQSFVEANMADDGGGAFVDGGQLALGNVLMTGNDAEGSGGALAAAGGVVDGSFLTLADNAATTSGLSVDLSDSATASFSSSIFAEDDGSVAALTAASSTLTVTYCDAYNAAGDEYEGVTDPTGSDGNIAANPRFVGSGDYTLQSASPCINTGDPTYDDTDGSRADMGAFGGPLGDW